MERSKPNYATALSRAVDRSSRTARGLVIAVMSLDPGTGLESAGPCAGNPY